MTMRLCCSAALSIQASSYQAVLSPSGAKFMPPYFEPLDLHLLILRPVFSVALTLAWRASKLCTLQAEFLFRCHRDKVVLWPGKIILTFNGF